MPIMPELAADIFEGGFSETFSQGERVAAQVLQGSFYERVFGLADMYRSVLEEEAPREAIAKKANPKTSGLMQRASALRDWYAGGKGTSSGGRGENYVAQNARVIEAVMVLTTHNCAQAYLNPVVGARVRELVGVGPAALAAGAWATVLEAVGFDEGGNYHARLLAKKRAAYGYRQAVFFVSCCEGDATREEVIAGFEAAIVAKKTKGWINADAAVAALVTPLRAALAGEPADPKAAVLGWYDWVLPRVLGNPDHTTARRNRSPVPPASSDW
jgi:hypothetical protein